MTNCNVTWITFTGDIPNPLLNFFIVHCVAICLIGALCNVVALWCVVGCSKTPPAVKVLLCAIFCSTLFTCLLVMPFAAHVGISKVRCSKPDPVWLVRIIVSLYVILAEMELLYITIMAFLRVVAVWSPTKRQVNMRTAVALLIGTVIYSTVTTMLVFVLFWEKVLNEDIDPAFGMIYSSLNVLTPVVLTIACYLSMIFVVRRNKQRLAATPDTSATGQEVMDQATRAMLAVFVSNLLFGLPHSIYHILPYDYHVFSYVIVHTVFYMHLVIDPLVFVWFNVHHRQRVLHALKFCLRWVSRRPPPTLLQATSTLPLHVLPQTSSLEPRKEQS